MKSRMVLFLVWALTFASVSFAQDVGVWIYDYETVLTNHCPMGTGDPLPDGTPVRIMWDQNNNGPDPSDAQPPLGDVPGGVNFNQFAMNGDYEGMGTGLFYVEEAFMLSPVGWPIPNPYYYLLIVTPTDSIWSQTFHWVIGTQDWVAGDWSCREITTCIPNQVISVPNPACRMPLLQVCATLCHANDGLHRIVVGPFPLYCATMFPVGVNGPVAVTAGCSECSPGGSCAAASGFGLEWEAWHWEVIGGQLYDCNDHLVLLPEGQEGCVCVTFDWALSGGCDCWLPVSFGTFSAIAGDAKVALRWNTLSETSVDHFDVMRDNHRVHWERATNSSSEHVYSWTDESVQNGTTYTYSIVVVNSDGNATTVATQSATPNADKGIVTEYVLLQNHPNPFNPSTTISFDLLNDTRVSLRVYDIAGRQVATLLNNSSFGSGRHSVSFDASRLPSGVYLYAMQTTDGFSATKKMILMK